MMFADRVLKALSKTPEMERVPVYDTDHETTIGYLKSDMTTRIKNSQVFDFGFTTVKERKVELPFSMDLFREGFLQLPAPSCFFTWTVTFHGAGPKYFVEKDSADGGHFVHIGAILCSIPKVSPEMSFLVIPISHLCLEHKERSLGSFFIDHKFFADGTYTIQSQEILTGKFGDIDDAKQNAVNIAKQIIFLLGRLNAEGIAREVITPSEKLNARRRKNCLPEMVKHTVVTIRPHRSPMGHSGPRDEYTPKRYHFRRGHIRRFKNGQKTLVRHCYVGAPEDGRIEHKYVVKNS
jgi:hypothetical protein